MDIFNMIKIEFQRGDAIMGFMDSFAHAIFPKNEDSKRTYISSGNSRLASSKFDDALTAFDYALEIDANCPEAWIGQAFAFHKLGKIDEAVLAYEKFIELEPNAFAPWRPQGSARENLPFWDKAFEAYKLLVEGEMKRSLVHLVSPHVGERMLQEAEEYEGKAQEVLARISPGDTRIPPPSNKRFYCIHCGFRLDQESKFCINCGRNPDK
jgi:tetratricopeptide (TPR) repeat protein